MTREGTPAFAFLQAIAADLGRGGIAFPTFSQATIRIRAALGEPDIDADRVAQIVSTEPLLAARLVQAANSVALNPGGRPIGDVRSAIVRVGMATVRSVAVSIALEQLRNDARAPQLKPFAESAWRHSIEVAAAAHALAGRLSRISPDEAMFAGLVHDIGHFYLLAQATRFPGIENHAADLGHVLADWHASIGRAVLHEFNLPDAVLDAVAEHENGHYRLPLRTMTDVVTLANLLCASTNPVAAYRNAGAGTRFEPEVVSALADAQGEMRALAAALKA